MVLALVVGAVEGVIRPVQISETVARAPVSCPPPAATAAMQETMGKNCPLCFVRETMINLWLQTTGRTAFGFARHPKEWQS